MADITAKEAGRRGGNAAKARHGIEHYRRINAKSHIAKAANKAARAAAQSKEAKD